MTQKLPKKRAKKFRLDMIIKEAKVIDKEKGLIRVHMIPDPRVWERKTMHGEEGYYHKLDKVFISMKVFADAAKTLIGVPIFTHDVGLKSKEDYLERSRKRLKERESARET